MARKVTLAEARARLKVDQVVGYHARVGKTWIGGTARVRAIADGTATLSFADGSTLTDVPILDIRHPETVDSREAERLFPELRPVKVTVEFLINPVEYHYPSGHTPPGHTPERLAALIVAELVCDLINDVDGLKVASAVALDHDALTAWDEATPLVPLAPAPPPPFTFYDEVPTARTEAQTRTIFGAVTNPGTDARALAYPGFPDALVVTDDEPEGPYAPLILSDALRDQIAPPARARFRSQIESEPLDWYRHLPTTAFADLSGPYQISDPTDDYPATREPRVGYTLKKIEVPTFERGKGLGSALLAAILDDADAVGAVLTLEVAPDHSHLGLAYDTLVAWYGRHGFTITDRVQGRAIMTREPRGGQA